MGKSIDYIFQKIALPAIAVAGVLLIFFVVAGNSSIGSESNAYIRVINCVISKNAVDRVQGDIEECYRVVEEDLNVELKRYDSSIE